MREKALMAWSGGKDSAHALYEIKKDPRYEIVAILTTVTEDYDRVSMHGIRRALLEKQAELLDFALEKVLISKDASTEEYESRMVHALLKYKELGVSHVVFGDIFLEDVKKYREDNLAKIDMKAVFPLWGRDTSELANDFLKIGFKAIITCIDTKFLDKRFTGRHFDSQFISELSPSIDPCGENGEFHSFVYDGPIFKNDIAHTVGDFCLRDDRFYYCDILPVDFETVM